MSEFAHSLMRKYGWSEGKGLGVDEDGIVEAVRVKIKADSHGVGYNPNRQHTNFWWEDCFNKASSNIVVNNNKEGVKIISKKKGNLKKTLQASCTPAVYKNFARPTIKDEVPHDGDSKQSILTDEELRRACCGRTAHKSARHGLNQAGKLARLAEHEKAFLKREAQRKKKPFNDGTKK